MSGDGMADGTGLWSEMIVPADDARLDLTRAVVLVCEAVGVALADTAGIEILPDRVRLTQILRNGTGHAYLDPDTGELARYIRTLPIIVQDPTPSRPDNPPQE